MSDYLAALIWRSDLSGELKPLAATLANIASDDGGDIYPSIDHVAWRLSCSRSSVERGVRELREMGILEVVSQGGGRGKTTEYRMLEEKLPKRDPWKLRQFDVVKNTTSENMETTSNEAETTSNSTLNHVTAMTYDLKAFKSIEKQEEETTSKELKPESEPTEWELYQARQKLDAEKRAERQARKGQKKNFPVRERTDHGTRQPIQGRGGGERESKEERVRRACQQAEARLQAGTL